MKSVSITDPSLTLTRAVEAAEREPLIVRKNGRGVAVLISMRDYQKLRRGAVDDFQCFCDRIAKRAAARGMTARKLDEILGKAEWPRADINVLASLQRKISARTAARRVH